MNPEHRVPAGQIPVFAFALIVGLSGLGCDRETAAPATSSNPNVLLVTFDTTRADYLSCYGHQGNTTPTIDAVAREGIRFANCYTPIPITLPSHTSMMTGLYPFQHKLLDNGGGVLDEKAVTLAELFRAAGYRTGAFVGAYVLHSRYGLNQGFDAYSDDFKGIGARMEDGTEFAERRAKEVSDAALNWLNQKDDRPTFLWVHYFDAHSPYEAPGRAAGGDLREEYAAEISYADGELSRVIRSVDALSSLSNRQTWTIITADHGEGLGEHGEESHAFFLYNTTLHVPLIIKGPGIAKASVSDVPVCLIDLYPSIAQWLKLAMPYEVAGNALPLAPQPAGNPRSFYFETIAPFHLYGWSPLEAVIVGKEKFVNAPKVVELYDMASDPGETRNLADAQKDRVAELSATLKKVKDSAPGIRTLTAGHRETDEASLRKLHGLGYVSGSQDLPAELSSLPDPKEMIGLVDILKNAEKLLSSTDASGAVALAEVIDRDPNNFRALSTLENYLRRPQLRKSLIPIAQNRMQKPLPPPFDAEVPAGLGLAMCSEGQVDEGMEWVSRAVKIDAESPKVLTARSGCLAHAGRFDEAVALWKNVLQAKPQDAAALDALGDLYSRKQDFAQAAAYYTQAATIDPKNAETQANLGNALLRLNKFPEATEAFQRALQLAPHLTPMRTKLGSLLLAQGKTAEAVEQFKLVADAFPQLPAAHYDLGVALSQTDRHDAAAAEFKETLRLAPDHGDAMVHLGVELQRLGQSDEGSELLLRATKVDAVAGEAHFNLAMAAEKKGDPTGTMEHLQQAASSNPPSVAALEELARRHVRNRNYAEAKRILREALNVAPDNLKIVNSLAMLLATCPEDAIRDGAEALRLAKLANEKTGQSQPAVLGTLAAAQAETGDYPAAIETANRALNLLGNQQSPLKGMLTRQLEEFRAGRPYRSKSER